MSLKEQEEYQNADPNLKSSLSIKPSSIRPYQAKMLAREMMAAAWWDLVL